RHDLTSSIYVTPIQAKEKIRKEKGKRIHVICGGGTGSSLMEFLVAEGHEVTVGVLNVLDSDHETASSLGIGFVEEAPFSPITQEAHAANLRLLENADLVIMTTLPFGAGNIQNLRAARHALERGIPLFIFKASPADHEFSYKEAEELLSEIKEAGVLEIKDLQELRKIIKEI
ncbi:heme ABC transporter ATP-binding protein, partial [archaeon]|nr:heme ABC transporter ATP-binding protein [archaeon]